MYACFLGGQPDPRNLVGHLKFGLARKPALLGDYSVQRHSLPPALNLIAVIVASGRHCPNHINRGTAETLRVRGASARPSCWALPELKTARYGRSRAKAAKRSHRLSLDQIRRRQAGECGRLVVVG